VAYRNLFEQRVIIGGQNSPCHSGLFSGVDINSTGFERERLFKWFNRFI